MATVTCSKTKFQGNKKFKKPGEPRLLRHLY